MQLVHDNPDTVTITDAEYGHFEADERGIFDVPDGLGAKMVVDLDHRVPGHAGWRIYGGQELVSDRTADAEIENDRLREKIRELEVAAVQNQALSARLAKLEQSMGLRDPPNPEPAPEPVAEVSPLALTTDEDRAEVGLPPLPAEVRPETAGKRRQVDEPLSLD
jgi:hypothetical protein